MKNFANSLQFVAVTLWVGGLWAIGYLAAPTLFAQLADRTLAGMLAGRMFTSIADVGLGCGAYLLLYRAIRYRARSLQQSFFWAALIMLVLTIAARFGVQPILANLTQQALPSMVMESVFKQRFATWHGIASGLYLIQSALGLVLVLKQRSA